MASTSSLSSSTNKTAAKTASKASSATSKQSGKSSSGDSASVTPPADRKSADRPAPSPPSNNNSSLNGNGNLGSLSNSNSSLSTDREQSYSYSRNSTDGYSLSSESKSITTEGTTRLVNSLVDAFSGESGSSGPGSWSSSSCERGSSSWNSSIDSSGFSPRRNERESTHTQKQFEHFDLARDQLNTAQQKVDRILNQAVEAKLNNEQPVPEQVVRKAERDQENLIRAEGRLSRAESQLAENQEFRRQAQGQFELERQSAEEKLLGRFEGLGPELRRAILQKFRPQINKDGALRSDSGRLEEQAKQFLKSDTRAQRLMRESRLSKVQNSEDKPLDLSTGAALEFEKENNTKLAEVSRREAEEANSSILVGSAQQRRQDIIERLQQRKDAKRGLGAPSEDPLDKAIERLDENFTRQTKDALENLDHGTLNSRLDLERKLGRSSMEVRDDLQSVVTRGGSASVSARSTLNQLGNAVERVELLGFPDVWGALRQSAGDTGPNLGDGRGHSSPGGGARARAQVSEPTDGRGGRNSARQQLLARLREQNAVADARWKVELLKKAAE